MNVERDVFDVVGIGIGPANLSLAALIESTGLAAVFLDRKKSFVWHRGMMLPDVQMQVHYLKDLVTPVDPTNRFSFPAFLVETRRLHRLLVTGRAKIPRREFEQYCRWAAERMRGLRFGVSVKSVGWDGTSFVVHTSEGPLRARSVVSGTGLPPRLPACAQGWDDRQVFHAAHLLDVPREFAGRRVAVVGGGQSGAEVVHHLLTTSDRPTSILWGTSRPNMLPLDDSPFMDELFIPNYSRHFHRLPTARRSKLVQHQRMASDGVSVGLLKAIYRRLYDLQLLDEAEAPCRILPEHTLSAINRTDTGVETAWCSPDAPGGVRREVDYVICATGYDHRLPDTLTGLRDRLALRGGLPVVREDFSLDWDGPAENRIFVQNAARHEFGVADPNLSLLAWRSAAIANSLLGVERYDIGPVSAAMDWAGPPDDDQDVASGTPMAVLGQQ